MEKEDIELAIRRLAFARLAVYQARRTSEQYLRLLREKSRTLQLAHMPLDATTNRRTAKWRDVIS